VTELNEPISREKIIVAVERVKLRKAAGFDEIPAEVLKNQTVIDLLFIILFCVTDASNLVLYLINGLKE
jgi:predicted ABC-type ATPase